MLRDFYEYKCNIYARLDSPFKMKVPLTGEWLDCAAFSFARNYFDNVAIYERRQVAICTTQEN